MIRSGLTSTFVALAMLLAGCGFQPMYAPQADGGKVGIGLRSIEIEQPSGRTAQLVRNELLQMFDARAGDDG